MPVPFQVLSHALPATYYIRILRGVILRGSDFGQMWQNGLILLAMGFAATAFAAVQFVRRRA
jgi:ABC-2 type transport system permease protein